MKIQAATTHHGRIEWLKNNEVAPQDPRATKNKKVKTHQIITNPLVSRKAQVTPRSSERIRKVKKENRARGLEKERKKRKEPKQKDKHNQERKPAGTSMVITWEVKQGKASQKKGLSPFPEQPCLCRGRVKPKIRTVPGVYGKLMKRISRHPIRRYIQNVRKMDGGWKSRENRSWR
jgi:hypothetical protein